MDLPFELMKSVAFVAMRSSDGDDRVVGTGFFLARNSPSHKRLHYVVTARHVVDGIIEARGQIILRVNLESSGATPIPVEGRWYFHPDRGVDLAVSYLGTGDDDDDERWDHASLPWHTFEPPLLNGRDPRDIAIGDDVFIMGLFRQHHGKRRNIPILRLGSIAAMPEERVTAMIGSPSSPTLGDIDAYLVETRSQMRLSGSPAFVVETKLANVRGLIHEGALYTPKSRRRIYFLGLVRGHFDEKLANVENLTGNQRANVGIATVVPCTQLVELFNGEDIRTLEGHLDSAR
jgi:hypothetical protein